MEIPVHDMAGMSHTRLLSEFFELLAQIPPTHLEAQESHQEGLAEIFEFPFVDKFRAIDWNIKTVFPGKTFRGIPVELQEQTYHLPIKSFQVDDSSTSLSLEMRISKIFKNKDPTDRVRDVDVWYWDSPLPQVLPDQVERIIFIDAIRCLAGGHKQYAAAARIPYAIETPIGPVTAERFHFQGRVIAVGDPHLLAGIPQQLSNLRHLFTGCGNFRSW